MMNNNSEIFYDEKQKFKSKDLLTFGPKLLIMSNKNVVHEIENIQSLYLYPLSLLDYINNLKENRIISINIISISKKDDYLKVFSNEIFNDLKSVEFLIKDDYDRIQCLKIIELIKYFYERNIKITLNIKNLLSFSNLFQAIFPLISYFKIFLPNILNTSAYSSFLVKLKKISNNMSNEDLLHIKTYLNIEQINYYEMAIMDFAKLKVDIFQVSKELLPIGIENENVNIKTQNIVRKLEAKYDDHKIIKFISVKNISTLYYPKFELDDRNSRKCYACKMKPYLHNTKILPCKVQPIFEDMDKWSVNYDDTIKYNKIIKNCGKNCDDCASIFENDVLNDVEEILKKYNLKELEFCFKR